MGIKRKKIDKGKQNLTKPLNLDKVMQGENGRCFGWLWDNTTMECSNCASNIICGIAYQTVIKEKAKQLEDTGAAFLDTASFDKMNTKKLEQYAKTGGDTKGLVELVKTLSGMADVAACVHYLKTYISNHPNISTKGGVVVWK